MPTFADWREVTEPLIIPILGKQYTVKLISIDDRTRWEASRVEDGQKLSDDEYMHIFLGDAYDQMLADKVPLEAMFRAMQASLAFTLDGEESARLMWETGGDPKAVKAYVTAKKRTAAAAARSTKRPASGSTTKTARSRKPASP